MKTEGKRKSTNVVDQRDDTVGREIAKQGMKDEFDDSVKSDRSKVRKLTDKTPLKDMTDPETDLVNMVSNKKDDWRQRKEKSARTVREYAPASSFTETQVTPGTWESYDNIKKKK